MLTPSMEDYLEAIFIEDNRRKVVRVKNIADYLNVKTASVIGALKSLSDKGLITHEKYGYIELTPEGRRIAKEIYKRHQTLTRFLHNILGVNPEIAKEDACKIEHYVHKDTITRLTHLINFIETHYKGDTFTSEFNNYINSKYNRSKSEWKD